MRNIYARNTLRKAPYMGGPRQVPRLPSPLSTPLHITLAIISDGNMEPIEKVLLHPMCVLSHLMCACKHCNVKLSLYYWTHWSCWWIYHFKHTDITRFFIIQTRHPGRLKKQIWVEKNSVGALVTCGKTPTTVTWSEHLKIYCRVIVTQ